MKHLHLERLDQCAPPFRELFLQFLTLAEVRGHRLLIVFTWRSVAEQWELYKKGRRKIPDGRWVPIDPVYRTGIVTNALPGKTAHNVVTLEGQPGSLGADVIPVDDTDQPIWSPPKTTWTSLYECASAVKLDSYGDRWGAYLEWDMGHLELPAWDVLMKYLGLTLPDAVAIMAEI